MNAKLHTLPATKLLNRLDADRRAAERRQRIADAAINWLTRAGWLVAILLVFAIIALSFANLAHADDEIDVQQGMTVTRFEGTLLNRQENGTAGSIEFGAAAQHARMLRPRDAVSELDGDYDVEIIPAHNGGGFRGEHCQRARASYVNVLGSGATYIYVVCP
jgi:hypothetical protein